MRHVGGRWVILAVVGVLSGAAVAAAQERVPVAIGYNRLWGSTALYVGQDRGFFNRPGIDVKFVEMNASMQMLEAVAAGSLVGATVTPDALVIAQQKIPDLRAVALAAGDDDPPSGYVVRRDSGIRTVADLKGRTIGVSSFGAKCHFSLLEMLKAHGLDPKKDVTIVEVPIPTAIAAVTAKRVDSACVIPITSAMVQKDPALSKDLMMLFTYDDIPIYKGQKGITIVLVLSGAFMTKNREAAREFLTAYAKGVRFAEEQPGEALQIWAKVSGSQRVKLLNRPPGLNGGIVDRTSLQTYVDVLHRNGLIRTRPSLGDLLDQTLYEEAVRRDGGA